MQRKVLQDLEKWKGKAGRKPLLLLGARQVGKTYILKSFGEKAFSNYHYVNFEDMLGLDEIFNDSLDPKYLIEQIEFALKIDINCEEDLLILDEIQDCPRALTSLKYFCEKMPELALCAAGSLLGVKGAEASFPVGKVDFINMFPMSFNEFLEALGEKKLLDYIGKLTFKRKIAAISHARLWERFKHYLIVGGLPEVVKTFVSEEEDLFKAINLVREKQDQLITGYLADMAKHAYKERSIHIEAVWQNIPMQLAKSQDGLAKKYRFKDVLKGKKGFAELQGPIEWLKRAGLIIKNHIVNQPSLPLKAYSEDNRFKLFIFDVGILGALSSLGPELILDDGNLAYKGYILENFVAQELLCLDAKHDQTFCWMKGDAEIEFLREFKGKVFPVEVKSAQKRGAKSLASYIKQYEPDRAFIFNSGNLSTEALVKKCPVYLINRINLLIDKDSLC